MQAELKIAALKAVNLFASKEETRYYLCGVLVQISLRHTLYVATDGHRMLVHREDLAEGAEANTLLGDFILPRAALDKLKAAKSGPAEILFSTFGEGKFLLGETLVTPVDGSFPQWSRAVPAPVDPEATPQRPQFNLAYCVDFQKAAIALGYGALAPHLHYSDASAPCAVTFGDSRQTFGVIMPVRNQAPLWAGVPEWAQAAPAAAPEAIAAE
jgi:DNA polymerase III sliding clamp (beta) subunit (PCNA family)